MLLNLICQLCPNDEETSKNLWELLLDFVIEHKKVCGYKKIKKLCSNLKIYLKKNETNNLRDIFKKMLLFGVLKADPIKEFVEHVIKEGRVNDFAECSKLSEQVGVFC